MSLPPALTVGVSQTLGAFELVDAIRRTVVVCHFKDQNAHLSRKKHHRRVQRPYITLEHIYIKSNRPRWTRANFQRPEFSHFAGPCRFESLPSVRIGAQ